MKKKSFIFIITYLILLNCFLMGQNIFDGMAQPQVMDQSERILLANSSDDYPVTPGDIYQLNYQPTEEIITLLIPVEIDYTLNIGVLGKINGDGLSFAKLKQEIEKKFSSAYPQGTPSLTINTIGMFQVLITGEIPRAQLVNAWGLSQLSDILIGKTGPFSSFRNVTIKDKKGKTKRYDLYKGLILGETIHNPYLKPGDTIIILRRDKEIELKGEVYRPGNYQILKDDTISDFIFTYGGGFTDQADNTRLRIERTTDKTLHLLNFDSVAKDKAVELFQDKDIVIIEPKVNKVPLVYIEGAIHTINENAELPPDETANGSMHNLIIQPYYIGDSVFDIMNKITDAITPDADLEFSYIVKNKDGEIIPINLQSLLFDNNSSEDYPIDPFDRIIIPFKAMSVIVNGDVRNPGTYNFIPHQKYSYYLRLSGGTTNGTIEDTIIIIDKKGTQKAPDEDIENGDSISIKAASIIVSGAIALPGEYLYIPGKPYTYYIYRAGGINYERSDGNVVIKDKDNNKKKKSEVIMPGDTIFIPSSSLSYNMSRYMTIISTTLSIIISSFIIYDRFFAQP